MKSKRLALRKNRINNKEEESKNAQKQQNLSNLKSTGNQKSRTSRLRIEEFLSSINKKQDLPFSHLIHSNRVTKLQMFKHICSCYMGISQIRSLEELSNLIQSQSLFLPTDQRSDRKTLFMDLDETLVHSTVFPILSNYGTVQISIHGETQTVYFNLRPYCYEFLKKVSQLYQIYIFTAAEATYAKAMMDFLNKDNKTILGCLSRESCVKTQAGYYIKDLRTIKNRDPSQMILVDNLTLSFGRTIENGVPILEFTNNEEDSQLVHLQKYLLSMAGADDVREVNRERWKLEEMGTMDSIFRQIFCQN